MLLKWVNSALVCISGCTLVVVLADAVTVQSSCAGTAAELAWCTALGTELPCEGRAKSICTSSPGEYMAAGFFSFKTQAGKVVVAGSPANCRFQRTCEWDGGCQGQSGTEANYQKVANSGTGDCKCDDE